jgi:hypothetical protein
VAASLIPDEVRRFILSKALTVPDVEALLVFRASGDAGCETASIASRLYVPLSRAEVTVAKLQELGAIERVEGAPYLVYRPAPGDLTMVLDALVQCYVTHLVQVTELIHSTEAQSAQAFADAFRIRKEI